MALKLKCPCGKTLSAPESAVGKRGKCPKCGMKFVVPGPKKKAPAATSTPAPSPTPEPAAEVEDDFGLDLPDLGGLEDDLGGMSGLLDEALDEPLKAREPVVDSSNPYASPQSAAPAKKQSTHERMGTLANGIKLVFWGTVLAVVAFLLAVFGGLAALFTGSEVPLVGVLISPFLSLGGYVLAVIGRIMCLSVPEKVGAKGLIYACVACDLAAAAIHVGSLVTDISPFIELGAGVLGLATLILFVLFIKAVARFIGQEHLAEDARKVILLVIVCIASIFLIIIPFVAILTIGTLLYGVYKYLNLLQHTAEYVRP
ncbi:MAG: hypothetical protein ACR2NU_03380 [Aeoliella sp.]